LAILGCGFMAGELLTGFMQRESVARRSISLSFLVQAGLIFVIAHSYVGATVLLMLFLLGASDGTTEIVYDTLVQLHAPRRQLAGIFAIARSVQNAGMLVGLAVAPLLVGARPATLALLVSAIGCAVAAALAAVGLLGDAATTKAAMVLPSTRASTVDDKHAFTLQPLPKPFPGRIPAAAPDARAQWCLRCNRTTVHTLRPHNDQTCTACSTQDALAHAISLRPLIQVILPPLPVTLTATRADGCPIHLNLLSLDEHGILNATAPRLDTRPFDSVSIEVPCHGAPCRITFVITDACDTQALLHTVSLAVTNVERRRGPALAAEHRMAS
ncbi:MAG TPA: hypothetical protein VE777_03680, partial [Gaiellales bacterium]|nr:hypothetical protein [Gaiellales bacterium]